LLVVAVALGLNNFGAAIAIGVSGVDRRTEIKVATVFGLCDVVMPAIGMLIGTGLAGPLGSAARWAGAGILFVTAVWGLIEAIRGDDDAPRIWHGWRLLVSGAALSLDDLAVGLALGTVRFPILLAVTAFGVMSFVMSIIGLRLGAKLGTVTGERGEVVAGIMLICLAGVMAAGWLLPGRGGGRCSEARVRAAESQSAVEGHLDQRAACHPGGGLLPRSAGQPGQGFEDAAQDLLALRRVGDRACGGGQVSGCGLLAVEGELRVREQVGVPGARPAGCAGDVVLVVHPVEPDLDAARLPGLPPGRGDVYDLVSGESARCLVVHVAESFASVRSGCGAGAPQRSDGPNHGNAAKLPPSRGQSRGTAMFYSLLC